MHRVKDSTEGDLKGRAAPEFDEITIRPLKSYAEFSACVALQKLTWGEHFTECVPPTILKVTQRIGGISAGAFDGSGKLLGFVFGMSGVEDGAPVHWSDMLAVLPEARNLGLGRRLKEYQADTLRVLGIKTVYWTYDPLVSRNAHLNLNKLGARVVEYVPDMYGDTDSDLHLIGTDRFVVAWRIDESSGVDSAALPPCVEDTPVLNGSAGDGGIGDLTVPVVRVEVPLNIDVVQSASLEAAVNWRATTRESFMAAMAQGYTVIGFYRSTDHGPCYYVLERPKRNDSEEI